MELWLRQVFSLLVVPALPPCTWVSMHHPFPSYALFNIQTLCLFLQVLTPIQRHCEFCWRGWEAAQPLLTVSMNPGPGISLLISLVNFIALLLIGCAAESKFSSKYIFPPSFPLFFGGKRYVYFLERETFPGMACCLEGDEANRAIYAEMQQAASWGWVILLEVWIKWLNALVHDVESRQILPLPAGLQQWFTHRHTCHPPSKMDNTAYLHLDCDHPRKSYLIYSPAELQQFRRIWLKWSLFLSN